MAYELANRQSDAQREFRRSLELAQIEMPKDPRNGQVRSRMAYLWAKLGRRREAESEIAQALASSPEDAATRLMAVKTYEALGDRQTTLGMLTGAPNDLLANVLHSRDLESLHQDPNFQQLLSSRQIQ